ncbi:PTS sugar transporter subunit IIC [Enterococcus cecorum]|nr:PTS sugar transporter subunit IIC [Enterococcus cecorum]
MSTMLSKKTTVFLMLGFFVTAYAKLSVTGVAIFAVILAVILYSLDKGNSNTPSAANQAPMDDLDDLEEL